MKSAVASASGDSSPTCMSWRMAGKVKSQMREGVQFVLNRPKYRPTLR